MTDLKRNVPELRFPEFEDEWEEKKLEEIVSFGKGKLLGKKDLTEDGKYLCILYGELYTKYGAIINNIESRTNVDPSKLKKADKNQILIPSSGETVEDIATASAINVTEDVYIGGDLNILTPQKDDGRFISLSLNSVNKWNVSRFAKGKTVVHLYNSDLKNLKINLPCQFEEQQKIGDFFSKLDHQIELEEEKLALLEEQKKGYMQKIFSQELRFKDENGEDYPDWEEKQLSKVLKDKGEGIKRGPFGGALKKEIFVEEGYAVYEQQNAIYDNQEFRYFITSEKYDEMKGFKVQTNDIIMSCSGTIGKLSKIPLTFKEGIINQALIRFRTNELVTATYFLVYMRSNLMQRKILSSNPGSAIVNLIPVKELRKLSFPVPTKQEQHKVSEFFSKLNRHIELQGKKVELLKQRKQGFLQKMFV
ncbi:restriction endonuclease subunit S [Staphylococcus delphini]|uniref:restriction endonuclease subunit S n=1 Tax=Staphylococcus delphini TaxID=53344 RepID=UPI0023B25BAA|nr:restriction endonuclease subunit S [Staphylococcus delphini]MDE9751954.1 restriction endonuclease subunit S [Staphylococcus delphini]MDE9789205.1 restriction endonuclease subunit S [Staphylococcus delphini]MDE9792013.1 restriction endonuclease subunit S [Staphylococcus delphini]MDE9794089.1 restriction endonuclease subunit S [Staphylococcus delphini]MDE9796441.1 restriction endonuclease subunit S [Staphylococcus delphini]